LKKTKYADYRASKKRAVDFSLVIPAYKEEKRLPLMLPGTIKFFEENNYNYEIIIVNDASTDKTTDVALSYSKYNGKQLDLKVI